MAKPTEDAFDLIVLGAGPAGEKGAAQAAYFGKRVAIVEREPLPGGAAVHTGTLPSKTLRETALFVSGYRQRDLYGVTVEVAPQLAISTLIARKNAVRDLETDRMLRNLDRHHIETVRGDARFLDPRTVQVTGPDRHRLASVPSARHPVRGSRRVRLDRDPWHRPVTGIADRPRRRSDRL